MSLIQILKMIIKILNLDMKADLLSSTISSKLRKNQTFKLNKRKILPIPNQTMNQMLKQMLNSNKNLMIPNQMMSQMTNQMNLPKTTYTSNLKITPRFQPLCMVLHLTVDTTEKFHPNIQQKETTVS
jgi:hypothetical protein